MIFATRSIEQADCCLAENGKTVVAYGWTSDENDFAYLSMNVPCDHEVTEDDEAYIITAGVLKALVLGLGQVG